jgi:hypothetical protein
MARQKTKRRPAKPVPDLLRRQRAIDATMRRFGGKVLKDGAIGGRKLKLGATDCIRLFRGHLVHMGHRGLPKVPAYSSPGGAMKALSATLAKLGAPEDGTLKDLADALLPDRGIAPAAMLPGDVAFTEAEPNVPAWRAGSMVIYLGSNKVLGWHPDSGTLAVIDVQASNPFRGAWRA